MNARARFLAALRFGTPDRVPLSPGWGRRSTRAAWRRQGLPADAGDPNERAYREAGGKEDWPRGDEFLAVNERMIPQFEEKVLERRATTQIVQDWKGNVCEIGNEFGPEYLREAIDFVTRRWIRCPVESRGDWEAMRRRYDPEAPARLPDDFGSLGERLRKREWPLILRFSGPFWQMREWLGFERLCAAFREDPGLVRDMAAFWGDYILRLMEKALRHAVPDMVHISEDMAFKGHAMISPAMARDFLGPVYGKWGDSLRRAGVPLYGVDSDGYVDELIPVWLEAGVNVVDPMEVAAGNDLPALRGKYGRRLAFQGGVDKRAIAAGGRAIEEEIRRLEPVIRDGGYIPGCDHGVPNNVAWPDYVRYVGLLARSTGWLWGTLWGT